MTGSYGFRLPNPDVEGAAEAIFPCPAGAESCSGCDERRLRRPRLLGQGRRSLVSPAPSVARLPASGLPDGVRIVEHTADTGIEAEGATLEQ